MPMKRIYILLTKTKSVPSRIIGLFTRAAYTHAAIAFEDEPEVFYSFSRLRERFPLEDIKPRLCGGLCSYYAERGGVIVGFETT